MGEIYLIKVRGGSGGGGRGEEEEGKRMNIGEGERQQGWLQPGCWDVKSAKSNPS